MIEHRSPVDGSGGLKEYIDRDTMLLGRAIRWMSISWMDISEKVFSIIAWPTVSDNNYFLLVLLSINGIFQLNEILLLFVKLFVNFLFFFFCEHISVTNVFLKTKKPCILLTTNKTYVLLTTNKPSKIYIKITLIKTKIIRWDWFADRYCHIYLCMYEVEV